MARLADIEPGAPLEQNLHSNHPSAADHWGGGPAGRRNKTLSHLLGATITGTCHAAAASG
jgi:hypothetical protein